MKTSDIVPVSLSRRELYDLVWSVPVPEAAARLGISRTWLTKICARAVVPYPSRTYWEQVAAGKRPRRERLDSQKGEGEAIVLRPRGRILGPPVAEAQDHADVRDRSARLHPVLTAWRQEIWREQERLMREPWRKKGAGPLELDKRRLRLLDALLKSIECRGHRIEPYPAAPGLFCLRIDSRRFEIVLRQDGQARRGADAPAPDDDAQALFAAKPWLFSPPAALLSLELRLTAEPRQRLRWSDGPDATLEDQLSEIVAVLARTLRDPLAHFPQAPAEAGEDGADDDGEARWLALRRLAAKWDTADRVRRLLESVKPGRPDGSEPSAEQAAWLDWAQARLDKSVRDISLAEVIAATEASARLARDG